MPNSNSDTHPLFSKKGGRKLTYNDLYNEIISLGFESETESDELMISSVNRALRTIFTERPSFAEICIYQKKYSPSQRIEKIEHKSFDVDTVSYNAHCYSFICAGEGSYKICEGDTEKTINFSGENHVERGFLHGEGRIEFFGDYSFAVTNLCFFDELFGSSESDIPVLTAFCEYDMRDFCDDFLAFAFAPTDDAGASIKGASLCGNIMKIPSDFYGRINLTYKRGAKSIRGSADEEIFVPSGCEHLLPLLAASYVWLDDDSEKAEYYMSLYREGMSAVNYYNRTGIGEGYKITNGWA